MNVSNQPERRPDFRRLIISGLAALVVIAGAWAGWELVLKDRLATRHWGVVEPGLIYRSGRLPLDRAQATLANHNIRVLIDLTENRPGNQFQLKERAAALALGIEYHNFPLIGDGTGDIYSYAQAIAVMHRARGEGKPVLVHCAAGAQRTGGVVAAYRVLVERKLPDEALAELKRYGWRPGKDQLLLNYLNRNMAKLAELLLALQVIDAIPDPLPVFKKRGDGLSKLRPYDGLCRARPCVAPLTAQLPASNSHYGIPSSVNMSSRAKSRSLP